MSKKNTPIIIWFKECWEEWMAEEIYQRDTVQRKWFTSNLSSPLLQNGIVLWYRHALQLLFDLRNAGKNELGGAGATLATVLWSDTSSYCAMSSVAAPPRHPAPSISNTSVMYWMYRVGAREWFRDTEWVVRV